MNSQKSLDDQLNELIAIGNKAGLYDAVDYIKSRLNDPKKCYKKVVWKMDDFEYKIKDR